MRRTATWVEPAFVVDVYLRGIGTSGMVRQTSFKAIGADKSLKDLRGSDRRR